MDINIGIAENDRKLLAGGLSHLLADTYAVYHKTHAYHWNVTGPMFNTLHLMSEGQYTELWQAVDEIAERIRALGHFAPGGYALLTSLTKIDEDNGPAPAKRKSDPHDGSRVPPENMRVPPRPPRVANFSELGLNQPISLRKTRRVFQSKNGCC